MTDLDGERRLAVAVLMRAALDIRGAPSVERAAVSDAIAWADEAGPDFRFWCDVAGIEPSKARRILRRMA